MRQTFLPFAQPDLDGSEIARVVEVLQGGWLTTGPRTRNSRLALPSSSVASMRWP